MAIHWKVPFVDLNGNVYSINIYDSSWSASASAVILTGATTPFATDEGNDSDLLKPSRVSSGSFTVIDEGNLSGIMPTSYKQRKVTLTDQNGSTIYWQGYIQPQQFGRDMFNPLGEVRFSITDGLGVLSNIDMDWASHAMKMETFGELIIEAITAASITVNRIEFPQEWHDGNDYMEWAKIQINRYNWFEDNGAENSASVDADRYDTISYLQLLENIAQQLGWTVSLDKTTLRFSSPKATTQCYCSYKDFGTYINGGSVSASNSTITVHPDLTTFALASLNNEEQYIQGAKTIKVEAMSNPMEDLELSISTKGLPYVRERMTVFGDTRWQRLIFKSEQKNLVLSSFQIQAGEGSTEAEATNIGYDVNNDTVGGYYIITHIAKVDIYKQKDVTEGKKINYSYTDTITVDYNVPYYIEEEEDNGDMVQVIRPYNFGNLPLAVFSGSQMPPQSNGCLDLSLDTHSIGSRIYLRLRVGNKYYTINGTWSTTPSNFWVNLDENGSLKSNKTLSMQYDGAKNYVIPINTLIGGDVELTIYGTSDYIYGTAYDAIAFQNLELNYCQPSTSTYVESDSVATYAARSAGYGQDEDKIILKMATKTSSLKNGYGLLYFGNSLAEKGNPQYLNTAYCTEEALLDKLKKSRFRITSALTPTIDCSAPIMPKIGEYIPYGGKTYMVAAREVDWRESEVKLLLIQKI